MGQLTIRGMDPELEEEIRNRAAKSGRSLNRVILDMISQHIGLGDKNKQTPARSLKSLAGGWSEQDANAFNESIKICEQVDTDMWK